jgi:trimeric autotransporter adhesin
MEFVMHQFLSKQRILGLALIIPLAACSAQNTSTLPYGSAAAAASSRATAPAWVSAFLYVLNDAGSSSSSSSSGSGSGSLSEYRVGRPKLLNVISNGISVPRALTFDNNGNVYVVNDGGSSSSSSSSGYSGSVTEYVGHGTQLLNTVTRGINAPVADATDGKGNLYVANAGGSSSSSSSSSANGSVTVYRHGHFRLIDTITDGIFGPRALAFDGSGHLYVLNGASGSSSLSSSSSSSGGSVTIYNSARRLIGTLTSGIASPVAMAVDSAGDVMVANAGASGSSSGSSTGSVVVFAAGSTTPTATITAGITDPRALTLDGSGNLYVANASGGSSSSSSSAAGGSVTVYSSGSTVPALTITDGITEPDSLAVAPNGWLYVSNTAASSSSSSSSSGGSVSVYLPGRTSARFTITKGIRIPVALGIN